MGQPEVDLDQNTKRRIFEKLDDHSTRLTRVEVCLKNLVVTTNESQARSEKVLEAFGTRLNGHLDAEDSALVRIREDVHFLKGIMDERRREKEQNPLYRLLRFLMRIIGIQLP